MTKFYGEVRWSAEDVQQIKPDWTLVECEEWLKQNEHKIKNRLVELGQEVIETLLFE